MAWVLLVIAAALTVATLVIVLGLVGRTGNIIHCDISLRSSLMNLDILRMGTVKCGQRYCGMVTLIFGIATHCVNMVVIVRTVRNSQRHEGSKH